MVTDSTAQHYLLACKHAGLSRDFASPECCEVAYLLGYFCHEVPNGYSVDGKIVVNPYNTHIYSYMERHQGVILGRIHNHNHAAAWDGKKVFDPKGYFNRKENYDIHSFIIVEKRR